MRRIGRDIAGYRVVGLVGAGGMGEVYRARDSKLGRDVAVKVRPRALTNDVDRFARIDREARVLAALNHPHIASIYGLEDSQSGPALILEFVEGPTLADRLTSGALPIAEALSIARQIADALDAAHEEGISLNGGAPQSVCAFPGTAVGELELRGGDSSRKCDRGLMRCPASGGPATVVTLANQSQGERHIFPSFLSDGRHFVYLSISRTNPEISGVYAGELGPSTSRVGSRLITTGFNAAFVAPVDSEPGVIVFARDGALFAQRFNEQGLEMMGDPIRLAVLCENSADGVYAASR
jgi:hypothetical protein